MWEEKSPNTETRQSAEEPPPILGTWRRLYTAVLFCLLFVILVLFVFTRYYEGAAL
jgi:hypothetical protein